MQGIDAAVDYKKVLKAFKKEFCCNGTVVEDPEQGNVIQLQGDQRKNVSQFLINVRPRERAGGRGRAGAALAAFPASERAGQGGMLCEVGARSRRCLSLLCAEIPVISQEGIVKKDTIKIHGF